MRSALVLVVLLLSAGAVGPTSAASASSATRLLVLLEPVSGGEPYDGKVDIIRDEAVVASQTFRVDARPVTLEFPLPPENYTVVLGPSGPHVFDNVIGVRMAGCEGDYRLVAELLGPDVSSFDSSRSGCLTLPAAALALAEEARAAASARRSRASISVGWPSEGDVGRYARGAFDLGFRAESETFLDAWGREVQGARFDTSNGFISTCSISASAFSANVLDSRSESVAVTTLRYPTGSFELVSLAGEGCSREFEAGTGGVYDRARTTTVTSFGASTFETCLLRNGWQGRLLGDGDAFPVNAVCPAWSALGSSWFAGAAASVDGARVMPVYAVEDGERFSVARVVFAESLAYPLRVQWFLKEGDAPVRSASYDLVGYAPGSAPLGRDVTLLPEPRVDLSPPDALRGPALSTARARFVFPLDEAVDAARSDPTLRDLAAMLARPDVALAGALLTERADPGSPVVSHQWALSFAAPGVSAVTVVCDRPGAAASTASVFVPATRCAQRPLPSWVALAIGPPPADFGALSLPAALATFDEAVARWDASAASASGSPVTYALYRPWSDVLRGAALAVGHGFPNGLAPVDVPGEGDAHIVRLDPATGRGVSTVTGLQRAAPLASVDSVALVSSPAPVSSAPLGDMPRAVWWAVGAAAAIGLLAVLLWVLKSSLVGLFTRLVRPRVLDAQMRSDIHALVLAEPGIHAREVATRLGRAHGVVDYHLDVLVREGYFTCIETPGFRRYFVAGRFNANEMRALSALREGQLEKLYRIIEANPGIHLADLAQRGGVSLSYASKSVKRLSEAGLVDQERVGRAVRLHTLER